ncbi:MAG: DUF924 family protein [Pseudomonadota bacterium]|nr:DUF924 family protein [Pseudomonadota bacterium]
MSENEEFDSILGFWFGKQQDAVRVNAEKSSLWWSKDAKIDSEIERRFGSLVEAAAWGDELETWASTPRGTLALVILNDQFPRNIWRGSAQAFAVDEQAGKRADGALAAGMDSALRPIERVFLYLPFEHSESPDDQNRSLALYRQLAEAAPVEERELFSGFHDFARRHHEIIDRFGRFPHRNAILGRDSTAKETAFLKQPGSSF